MVLQKRNLITRHNMMHTMQPGFWAILHGGRNVKTGKVSSGGRTLAVRVRVFCTTYGTFSLEIAKGPVGVA